MIDIIDLIFKIIILFILAATSQLAFKKRLLGVMILTLGFWLTFFRTAILRAIVISSGLFDKVPKEMIKMIQEALMSANIVIITDIIALIGSIITFIFVATEVNGKIKTKSIKTNKK